MIILLNKIFQLFSTQIPTNNQHVHPSPTQIFATLNVIFHNKEAKPTYRKKFDHKIGTQNIKIKR